MEEVKIANPSIEDNKLQIITPGNSAMSQISNADEAYYYFKNNWSASDMQYEKKMFAAIIDAKNNVLKHYIIPDYLDFFSDPEPIIKYIQSQEKKEKTKGIKIYFAENDTFGEFTYGKESLAFLDNIKELCAKAKMLFIDQLIISQNSYFSFKNNKLC